MNQHVCLEMRRSCEGVITLFGTERFFSGMNHRVALEGRVITTCARTIMNQNMFFFLQIARSIACVVALVASEGPLSVIQKLLGMVGKVVCFHIHVFSSQGSFKWC
jgi:hypothetical protein